MSSSEIRALIEKAKESLEVATDLVRDEHYDFAASRAYYAMFYIAEALLAELGQADSRHSAVIAAFGREYSKTKKLPAKFHKQLIAAQNFRNVGDYGIDQNMVHVIEVLKPVPVPFQSFNDSTGSPGAARFPLFLSSSTDALRSRRFSDKRSFKVQGSMFKVRPLRIRRVVRVCGSERFSKSTLQWVEQALENGCAPRDDRWSEAIAVGELGFC